MTETEQQIAIAEFCPDICHLNDEGSWVWKYPILKYFDPLHDLNAILPILPKGTTIEFCDTYFRVSNDVFICRGKDLAAVACEYLLRTINKWKE